MMMPMHTNVVAQSPSKEIRNRRENRDFAFFCVRTNETSASSQFAQLFSLAKTLQRSGT